MLAILLLTLSNPFRLPHTTPCRSRSGAMTSENAFLSTYTELERTPIRDVLEELQHLSVPHGPLEPATRLRTRLAVARLRGSLGGNPLG